MAGLRVRALDRAVDRAMTRPGLVAVSVCLLAFGAGGLCAQLLARVG